jgi:DinB superfamily
VAEPAAYQAHLLGLLGGDDPAQVQAATPPAIRAIVDQAGSGLRTRPTPAEWSVLECVGHLHDAEVVYAGRYRWILAHDAPPLIGYDQDRWVDRLRHNDDDPGELLDVFESLRKANLALWRRVSPEEAKRVGRHAERGPESFDLSFRLIAGHDRLHLDQARRTVEQAGSRLD